MVIKETQYFDEQVGVPKLNMSVGKGVVNISTVDASVMQNSYKFHCNLAMCPGFRNLEIMSFKKPMNE